MLSAKGCLTRDFAKGIIRKPNLLAASTGTAYSKARSCSQMPRGSPREFNRKFQRRGLCAEGLPKRLKDFPEAFWGCSRVLSRVLRASQEASKAIPECWRGAKGLLLPGPLLGGLLGGLPGGPPGGLPGGSQGPPRRLSRGPPQNRDSGPLASVQRSLAGEA